MSKKHFVMLVANSEYDHRPQDDSKEVFWPIPGALKDLDAMREKLKPTVFDLENNPPAIAKNLDHAQFTEVWEAWFGKIIEAAATGSQVTAYFYYSGHGVAQGHKNGEMTYIVHKDGSLDTLTPIEEKLRRLSIRPNVKVLGFLDCCRKRVELKSGMKPPTTPGQHFIGFGCKIDKTAQASSNAAGTSWYTAELLKLFDNRDLVLPRDFLQELNLVKWGDNVNTISAGYNQPLYEEVKKPAQPEAPIHAQEANILFEHIGYKKETEEAKGEETKADSCSDATCLVVIGKTGTGKSTLCNALVDHKFLRTGRESKFRMSADVESVTMETTSAKAMLFGLVEELKIHVVDTPGLSDSGGKDAAHIIGMIKYLKTISCGINQFLFTLNGQEPRIDDGTQTLITVFQQSFGKAVFWEKCSLVYTRWQSTKDAKKQRKKQKLSEESRKEQIIAMLCKIFSSEEDQELIKANLKDRIFFTDVFEIDDCFKDEEDSDDEGAVYNEEGFDEKGFKGLQTHTELMRLYTMAATSDKILPKNFVAVQDVTYKQRGNKALQDIKDYGQKLEGEYSAMYLKYFAPITCWIEDDFRAFSAGNFEKLTEVVISEYERVKEMQVDAAKKKKQAAFDAEQKEKDRLHKLEQDRLNKEKQAAIAAQKEQDRKHRLEQDRLEREKQAAREAQLKAEYAAQKAADEARQAQKERDRQHKLEQEQLQKENAYQLEKDLDNAKKVNYQKALQLANDYGQGDSFQIIVCNNGTAHDVRVLDKYINAHAETNNKDTYICPLTCSRFGDWRCGSVKFGYKGGEYMLSFSNPTWSKNKIYFNNGFTTAKGFLKNLEAHYDEMDGWFQPDAPRYEIANIAASNYRNVWAIILFS